MKNNVNKEKINVNIGLDIGIASVGWAILDEKFKILEHGVRLFQSMDGITKDNRLLNEERREKRHTRRNVNRRRNLKKDFLNFLIHEKFIDLGVKKITSQNWEELQNQFDEKFLRNKKNETDQVIDLRKKGIEKKLTKKELVKVLYWYLGHRGFKYEIPEEDDKSKKTNNKTKKREDILKGKCSGAKLPIDFHYCLYKDKDINSYRGNLNRTFSSNDYEEEINKILENFGFDEKLKEKFLKLFWRQRGFEKGPGSLKVLKNGNSNLIVNRFTRFYFDEKEKEWKEHPTMWKALIGKCSVYPELDRAPKKLLTAQVFNLLNDLNNIKITDSTTGEVWELTKEQKIKCLELALTYNLNDKLVKAVKEYLAKELNSEIKDLNFKGFRIQAIRKGEKKGEKKDLLTILSSYFELNKILKKYEENKSFDALWDGKRLNLSFYDSVIEVLSEFANPKERIEKLKKLKLSDKLSEDLANNLPLFAGTHSLSKKAMEDMFHTLINENKNQMQIIYEMKKENDTNKDRTFLDKKWLENLIASPTMKRAVRQTINLLNEIIKTRKRYYVQNLIIEMPRETNSKKAKEMMWQIQMNFESRNKSIESRIKECEKIFKDKKVPGKLRLKVWLFMQQRGLDAYTSEKLDFGRVVKNPSYCDIDHIIPYSQSHDDSRNNKVLTLSHINAKKGQRTPYQFLGKEKFAKMKNKWMEWYLPKNNTNDKRVFASWKKYELLTSTLDFSKPENAAEFIQRNLVDTRYAAREVLNNVKNFIENINDKEHPFYKTKVKTVNGRMTNFLRKAIENNRHNPLLRPEGIKDGSFDENTGKKERVWNGHHAEDAVIMIHGALKNPMLNKFIEKILSDPFIDKSKLQKIGEEQLKDKWTERSVNPKEIREELNNKMNQVKFSHMLQKRNNMNLFNETLYGKYEEKDEKDNTLKIRKVTKYDISEMDLKNLAKFGLLSKPIIDKNFKEEEKKKNKLNDKYIIPMKENDKNTWNALVQTISDNINVDSKKTPLKTFIEKNNGLICVLVKNKKGGNTKRCIKNIKVIQEQKDKEEIIQKRGGIYESMNWSEIHLYKDNKNKWVVIPINCLVAKYKNDDVEIDTEKLKKVLKRKNVDTNLIDESFKSNPNKIRLYKGSIILNEKNQLLYKVAGHGWKQSRIELKRIDKVEKKQTYYTVNTKMNGWFLVSLSYLGNIKKIKKF